MSKRKGEAIDIHRLKKKFKKLQKQIETISATQQHNQEVENETQVSVVKGGPQRANPSETDDVFTDGKHENESGNESEGSKSHDDILIAGMKLNSGCTKNIIETLF